MDENGQELTAPGDDEAWVRVADPGVPATHQRVRDAVATQLHSIEEGLAQWYSIHRAD